MTIFIAVAAVMALVVGLLVVRPLLFRRVDPESREAKEAAFFRAQLKELDRDIDRGIVGADEADGARAEISRRLIRANRGAEAAGIQHVAPKKATQIAIGLGLVAAPLLAALVYWSEGAPGEPDMPLAERQRPGEPAEPRQLTQAEAERAFGTEAPRPATPEEEQYARTVDQLRGILADRPQDAEGHRLLAGALMQLGRYREAADTFTLLIDIQGEAAPASSHLGQAEALIQAAGGYISPEARQALADTLRRDPSEPAARYYAGVALAQNDRMQEAIDIWEGLRDSAPANAPWLGAVEQALTDARARVDARRQAALPGPSADDIAAAEALSPQERQEMIEGMVAQLDARLEEENGTPEEWLQLVTVYWQLDRPEDARNAYLRSQQALSGSEASFVREQALVMGVIPE